jgi:hypothetical protein
MYGLDVDAMEWSVYRKTILPVLRLNRSFLSLPQLISKTRVLSTQVRAASFSRETRLQLIQQHILEQSLGFTAWVPSSSTC